MLGILNRSLLEQTPVEIIYMSKGGIITQRKIMIKSINETSVMGFCMLRNKKRTFLIENILSADLKKRLDHFKRAN